ncbi:MAG: TolC family protein [Bacillota bacterium]
MKLLVGCVFTILLGPVAKADVSLEEVIESVWSSSPQIKNQQIQYDLSERDRIRRFIFNEPQFQYSNADDNTSQSFGVQLPLGFPGKAFVLKSLDDAKAHSQKAELNAKKYDLAKMIGQSYIDCASAQEALALQKVTVEDLETVYKSMRASYESGHGTQAERIGAELQYRQAQLDWRTAEDKVRSTCKKMARLMGEGEDFLQNKKFRVPDDIDKKIIDALGTQTSDQERAAASMEVTSATIATSHWSQLPDFNLSVTRNHYLYLPGSPSGKEWTTTYGVGVTIPLLFPFYEMAEAKRTQSQALIDNNNAQMQKIAADSDRQDAANEYHRNKKRLQELRHTDLSLAEALVESTNAAYRSGKLGYAELVLARKTLADLKNQDIQLRASIVMAHMRCLDLCEEKTGESAL